MFREVELKQVIGKLMAQIEEEKRLRIETIQALTSLPLLVPYKNHVPTEDEIERRILELL